MQRWNRRLLGATTAAALLGAVAMAPALATEQVTDPGSVTPTDEVQAPPDTPAAQAPAEAAPADGAAERPCPEAAEARRAEARAEGRGHRHGTDGAAPGRGEHARDDATPGRGAGGDAVRARDGSAPQPGRGPGPGGHGAGEGPCATADA